MFALLPVSPKRQKTGMSRQFLHNKSLTELRQIALSFGIADVFSKPDNILIQEIELKQVEKVKQPLPKIPKPQYDARLMTKPPAFKSDKAKLEELLEPYKKLGLKVEYDEERWYMRFKTKTDEGTLRMPLRTVLDCADKLMQ